MADQEQLDLITEDGVQRWNAWLVENPRVLTDLSGADLQGFYLVAASFRGINLQDAVLKGARLEGADLTAANLAGVDFSSANLTKAKLSNARLEGANLTKANLSGADLTGANLRNTNLTDANFLNATLMGANFRGATLERASFVQAKIDHRTVGLGRLLVDQRAAMIEVQVEAIPEDAPQEPTQQVPDKSDNLTVGYAKSILGPAHEVLIGLSIPNDLSEAHRDLFHKLLRSIEDLQQSLADFKDENRRLSDEPEELRKKLDDALPLWRRAWETFVLKGAETAGQGAVFTAGFIAGATFSAFTAEAPGIPI